VLREWWGGEEEDDVVCVQTKEGARWSTRW
jgi:hypothetical protein